MTDIIETEKQNRAVLIAELEKAGAKFRDDSCTCPFHPDKRPSAGVYEKNGHWYFKCQACGVSGDVWDIKSKNEKRSLSDTLKAARNGSEPPKRKPQPVAKARKVYSTLDNLKKSCLGTVESEHEYTNPATGKADMVVIRYQTPDGKTYRPATPYNGGFEMKTPPKPWPLYNRVQIQTADTILVAEGERCCDVLAQYGIVATTNPCGALKGKYADWSPLAGKNLILWPDCDDNGFQHMREVEGILHTLEPAPRVSIINPADLGLQHKEDAADLIEQLCNSGADVRAGLTDAIQKAKPRGIATKLFERFEDIINGKRRAIAWPQTSVSKLSKALTPGTVTLICGSPGASKSFWLLECLAYWLNNGIKACVYELEEDREFHLTRALAQKAELSDLTNPDWVEANPAFVRAAQTLNTDFIEHMGRSIYAAPDMQITLEQLADWADDRAKAGYRIICIDPVTAAALTAEPWNADKAFLLRIKRISTDYGCSFVLVTHPAKTVSGPDINQLAGSAAYPRFSQSIFWLQAHDPMESNVRTDCGTSPSKITHNRSIHILKARNGIGQGLSLACNFDSNNLRLQEHGIVVREKTQTTNN